MFVWCLQRATASILHRPTPTGPQSSPKSMLASQQTSTCASQAPLLTLVPGAKAVPVALATTVVKALTLFALRVIVPPNGVVRARTPVTWQRAHICVSSGAKQICRERIYRDNSPAEMFDSYIVLLVKDGHWTSRNTQVWIHHLESEAYIFVQQLSAFNHSFVSLQFSSVVIVREREISMTCLYQYIQHNTSSTKTTGGTYIQ